VEDLLEAKNHVSVQTNRHVILSIDILIYSIVMYRKYLVRFR